MNVSYATVVNKIAQDIPITTAVHRLVANTSITVTLADGRARAVA